MTIYTSYYARVSKLPKDACLISISATTPDFFDGFSLKQLAPTYDTLMDYKNGGTWEAYVDAYKTTTLSKLNQYEVLEIIKRLAKDKDVYLLCFEKDSTHCHRSLVADWFRNIGVDVQEAEV